FRSLVRHAGNGGFSSMGFDDGFDEAQAKAEPALGTAFVAAIEARPDFVLLLSRNADPGVFEADYSFIAFGANGDRYRTTFGGVFDGVVEEVGQRLARAEAVHGDKNRQIRQLGADGDFL